MGCDRRRCCSSRQKCRTIHEILVNQRNLFRRVKRLRSISPPLLSFFTSRCHNKLSFRRPAHPRRPSPAPVALALFMCHGNPHIIIHMHGPCGGVSCERERLYYSMSLVDIVCRVLGVMEKRVDIIGGKKCHRFKSRRCEMCNF